MLPIQGKAFKFQDLEPGCFNIGQLKHFALTVPLWASLQMLSIGKPFESYSIWGNNSPQRNVEILFFYWFITLRVGNLIVCYH